MNRADIPFAVLKMIEDPAYDLFFDAYASEFGKKKAREIVHSLSGECLNDREMGWCIPNISGLMERWERLEEASPFNEKLLNGLVIPFFRPNEAYGVLSQWFRSYFTIEGVTYKTAEQYMMARKALLFHDYAAFDKIIQEEDPAECKALGREVRHFKNEEWMTCREEIVFNGNYAKFKQNRFLTRVLLRTGDAVLAEANPHDKIWGVGISATVERGKKANPAIQDQKKWRGKNLLGNILMQVRERLKLEYQQFEIIDLGRRAAFDNLDPDHYNVSDEQRDAMEQYLKAILGVRRWDTGGRLIPYEEKH